MESSCIIYTPISFEINIDKLHFLLKKTHLCIYIYIQRLNPRTSGSIPSHKTAWLNHGSLRCSRPRCRYNLGLIRLTNSLIHGGSLALPNSTPAGGLCVTMTSAKGNWFSSDVELEFFHLYVYMYDKYRCDIYIYMYVCMI